MYGIVRRIVRVLPTRRTHETLGDSLFRVFSGGVALGLLALLGLILLVLIEGAAASIGAFGSGFLIGGVWHPRPPRQFAAPPFFGGAVGTPGPALRPVRPV